MKKRFLQLVAAILLVSALPLALFSCTEDIFDSTDNTETNANVEETEKQNDSEISDSETSKPEAQSSKITLFKDRKYELNVICPDIATSEEKTAYNLVRSILKSKTGKSVELMTDFVAEGNKLDDSFAILVGETAYEESKTVYASLAQNTAVAKIVNNKYVIAFQDSDSLNKLLVILKEKIANAPLEEIVIDSTWEINIPSSSVPSTIELPKFDGKALTGAIDIGQGSKLYIISNTTAQKYLAYTTLLTNSGFEFYTMNSIADNEFCTFTSATQIVNVMFYKNLNEVRITVDDRQKLDLPGLKEENVYSAVSTPSFTMMGISDAGYPGGMSFIYKLSDGTFFIIDGGICANRIGSNQCSGDPSVNRLFKTLQTLADDPNNIVISGWLVTHIHNDHAGAFIDMAEKPEYLAKVSIKKLIYSQPADSDMKDGNQPKRLTWMTDAISKLHDLKVVKAHAGQEFNFADLKLTILGNYELVKPTSITSHNNSSTVSVVEFGGKKMLFLADAEGDLNAKLDAIYGSWLNSDILQVAHHGYNNTNAGIVYKHVSPDIVLWPIQSSDFKSGANVFNVGFNQTYLTKRTTKHYVGGAANTTFENLNTWIPTRENWKP